MFKNREFRVQMVKAAPASDEPPIVVESTLNSEEVAKAVKDVVKYTAIAVGSVYVIKHASYTAREVAYAYFIGRMGA